MYYGNIKPFSVENGPGVRVSLFISGCTHKCQGCFSADTWDFAYGRPFTEQTEDELNTIVDLGGTVVDVFVWHKVYGKVTAPLNIFSRLHVKQFIEGVRSGKSTELMNITGGYHYHTVRAESEHILDEIEHALKTKNYIAPEI